MVRFRVAWLSVSHNVAGRCTLQQAILWLATTKPELDISKLRAALVVAMKFGTIWTVGVRQKDPFIRITIGTPTIIRAASPTHSAFQMNADTLLVSTNTKGGFMRRISVVVVTLGRHHTPVLVMLLTNVKQWTAVTPLPTGPMTHMVRPFGSKTSSNRVSPLTILIYHLLSWRRRITKVLFTLTQCGRSLMGFGSMATLRPPPTPGTAQQ